MLYFFLDKADLKLYFEAASRFEYSNPGWSVSKIASNDKIIGIVGGVGPYAGIDLARKVFDQTEANSDQEHLPVAILSMPAEIGERTAYILGQSDVNPAYAIVKVIIRLDEVGAAVVGISCNSAHAPSIIDVIIEELKKVESKVKLLHMIEETAVFIQNRFPEIRKVGVVSTTGTSKSRVYADFLEKPGLNVVLPDELLQAKLHEAINNRTYGIKAQSNPVTQVAMDGIWDAIRSLQEQGAEAIILGCTEIPLAVIGERIGETTLIDPTQVLARALIRETYPEKLKPLKSNETMQVQ